ncbi:ribosomal-protein-alanine N-acetyltransferase [Ruminococcaceae bacterium YRB3002]|nr:ribosomal-protein-alanine N-acetyltransferase [Ruminococcaceae bacterium YRB3002]
MRHGLFDSVPVIRGDGVVLRPVTESDIPSLEELVSSDVVYRYEPTFMFERNVSDISTIVSSLYGELFASRESLILCIEVDGAFAGLAEFYGFRDELHKISIGYRLLPRFWGQGIATRTVAAMVEYLYGETDIEIITASTMVENKASARVLEKNGFDLVVSCVGEDWGYEGETMADKWIR